jgi:hypothetical protein
MSQELPTNLNDQLKPKNEEQAQSNLEFAEYNLNVIREKLNRLNEEDDTLRGEVSSNTNALEKEHPLYERLIEIRKVNEDSWSAYWEIRKEKNDEENEEVKAAYAEYTKTYKEKRYFEFLVEDWLETNFPKETENINQLKSKQSYFYENFVKVAFDEKNVILEKYKDAYQEYSDLEGITYENGVNGFLKTTQEYQKKRLKDLDTTLIERLRSAGRLSDENILKGKEKLKQVALALNIIPAQWRNLIKMKAVWAFLISLSAFALHKQGDVKTRSYLEPRIDSIYASINSLEHDSIRNIIFHNISGADNMPEEWRKFIANEDRLEFTNLNKIKEFINESKNNSQDYENKLNYIVLQQMNAEYGNPKVQYGQNEGDKDRASYSSWDHTMFLPTHAGEFRLSDYFAELAHAKQFHADPDKYNAWNSKDYNKYDSIARANNISYHDAQLGEYSDSTTLEFEAHSKIEKTFQEEFDKRKKDLVEKILNSYKK